MADTRTLLSTAPDQTQWKNTVGGTIFYIRKLTNRPTQTFRIWNSGDPGTFYTIGLNDAVAYYNVNIVPKPAPPVTPPAKNPPKPNNLKGAADGDNSGGATAAKKPVPGKASAAKTAGSKSAVVDEPPGRRLKNPLAYMASYNYQLSLYMITPDAYDAFIDSGYKNIYVFNEAASGVEGAGGAFLIAQSGGINNGSDSRSPWFNTDIGIDNLKFNNVYATTADSGAATAEYEVTFDLFEPYGFSFLSNLKRAGDAMAEYARNLKSELSVELSPLKQHFILGIRFYGFDDSGNVLTGNEIVDNTVLDINSSGTGDINGLFTKYIDITLNTVKFTLDGKSTKYACSAETISQQAMGEKRGILSTPFNPTAKTVGDVLQQLTVQLNTASLNNSKKSKQPTTYSITYAPGSESIRDAAIVSPADLDKLKWPGSGAKTTDQVNDKTDVTSSTSNAAREFKFTPGIPVLDVITGVITQSQYLEAALKTLYTTSLETEKKGIEEQSKSNPVDVAWFSCVPKLSNARWDQEKADWNYDIEYQIKSYRTPIVKSSYIKSGGQQYGPMKRYDYWYSGKNSEVIEYRHEFNNKFYEIVLSDSDTSTTSSDSVTNQSASNPKQTGQRQNQPRLGRPNVGMEAQNSYLTSLYSPADQAKAKLTIYGDPDLIGIGRSSTTTSGSESKIYDAFYTSDGAVNADAGQVFIEINFNEATDYNESTGTLDINKSVVLWVDYPPELNIRGVSYSVTSTTSTFSGGKFTQVLDCTVNMPTAITGDDKQREPVAETAPETPGPSNGNGTGTTSGNGLKTDPTSPKSSVVSPVGPLPAAVSPVVAQLPPTISPGTAPVTVNGAPDINATGGGFNLTNVGNTNVNLNTITSGIIPQNVPVADDDSVASSTTSTSFNTQGRISTPFQINTNLT